MQSNISKFTITTDTNKIEYTQCESYKITNYNENLLNKISFFKPDKTIVNDKPVPNAQNKFCYVQEAYDAKKIKLLCDFQDKLFNITGIFDYDYSVPENTSCFLLVVNYTILILVDVNREEFISDNSIKNFIEKNKADPRLKSVRYEFDGSPNNPCNYSCLINQDENKNPKIIWKFNEKIITLKFRPRIIDQNSNQIKVGNYLNSKQSMASATVQNSSFIAISFHLGKLKIFHFESKALVAEFKSSFGNIITLDYSADGKLLGVGTESDEAFVIEAESNSFLYCLEGHKNFVSSIIFEEQIQNDEDQLDAVEEQKQLLNSSHMETITAEYNSNPIANNYIRQTTSANVIGALGLAASNNYKQPTRRINPLELFENLREESELGNSGNFQARVFDPKSLRRTRSSIPHQSIITNPNNSNNNNNINNNNECKIFDVYTAGYDGYLGVWRIEYNYDPDTSGLAKQLGDLSLNPKDSNIVKKVASPKPTLLANLCEKNVFYTDFVKIQNVPIFTLKMIYNMLFLIGKRNNTGSSVFVKFFHGLILSDDPPTDKNANLNGEKVISEEAYVNTSSSNNNQYGVNSRKRNSNVESKYQELKQLGANAKANGSGNPNNSSVNTNSNSASNSFNEGREREGKDLKDNNKRGNSKYKDSGNVSSNGNNNYANGYSRNAINKSPFKDK